MANTSVTPTRGATGATVITGFPLFAFAVTPSDTANFVDTNATGVVVPVSVYVGTSGNVTVTPYSTADANKVTFTNVPAGTMLPVQVNKIWNTGTTASNIVGIC